MKKIVLLLTAVVLLGAANAQTRKINKKAKAVEPPVTVERVMADGMALYDSTKYEEAIVAFEKCIAMDSTYGDAYLYLASAHWRLGFDLMNTFFDSVSVALEAQTQIGNHLDKSISYGESAILYIPPTDCVKKLKAYCLTIQSSRNHSYASFSSNDYISPAIDLVEKSHLLDSCPVFISSDFLDINSPLCEFLYYLYESASFQADKNLTFSDEENRDELVKKCIKIDKTILQHLESDYPYYDWNTTYLKLADIYIRILNYDSAYTYLTKLDDDYITESGMDFLYSYSAFILYMAGRYNESVDKYAEIITDKKSQAWSDVNYCFNRDFSDLLTKRLMKISDGFDNDDWFFMSQYLFIQNDYETAIQINESLRKQGKSHISTDYFAALSTLHMGDYKKAVKCFDAMIKDNPDVYSLYQHKVEALNVQGKKKAAYKNAQDLFTNHFIWNSLLDLEFMNQNYDRVITLCDQLLKSYIFEAVEEEAAIEEIAVEEPAVEVVDEEPLDKEDILRLVYDRAYSYILSGHPEKAKDDLLYLVENANIDMQAHAYVELGRSDEALKMLSQIKEANIRNPRHHKSMCVLYTRMGNTDKALNELETALQLGFRDFYFLETDPLISSLRELPTFKELVKKYKKIPR